MRGAEGKGGRGASTYAATAVTAAAAVFIVIVKCKNMNTAIQKKRCWLFVVLFHGLGSLGGVCSFSFLFFMKNGSHYGTVLCIILFLINSNMGVS